MIRVLIAVIGTLTLAISVLTVPAAAQNTAGVFGPGVSEGDQTAEYRVAFSPGQDGGDDGWVQRIHYQQAFDDKWRGRIVLQGSDLETGNFEFNFLQAELQYQFQDSDRWDSALRADVRISEDDDGADQLGLNWTNRWYLDDRWTATGILLTSVQTGSRRVDGVAAELRASLGYRLDNGATLALSSFNPLGRGKDFGDLDDNNQQLGPTITGKVADNTSILAGALFGLTDASSDVDLRFWLTQKFR